jgi:hypothetical protein
MTAGATDSWLQWTTGCNGQQTAGCKIEFVAIATKCCTITVASGERTTRNISLYGTRENNTGQEDNQPVGVLKQTVCILFVPHLL